jgi:putative FmdB family regulatory protein
MPIYEYECRGCGHRFEFLLLPSTVPACPSCNGKDLEREISLFAVSSDGSRKVALSDGRKRAAGVQREKAAADAEYIKNHPHD